MNKKRKMFLQLLLGSLVVCMLVSCSYEGQVKPTDLITNTDVENVEEINIKPNELYELGNEPLHATFYGHYNSYRMPNWGADLSSKWIQDNLDIHIKAIHADGDSKHKLQQMVASKKLPDIIWGDRGSDLERLRSAGLLVPLDDYINKYPNLKKWAGEKILNLLRSRDGKIYYFPNYYTDKQYGNAGYVVNKRIYRELGQPKLQTTDDLYNYLKLVKENYPGVVPFETGQAIDGHGIDQLFSAFKEENYSYTRYLAVASDKKMVSIYQDPGFRESALFIAKLMREGLMTQDAMTQTQDQVAEKFWNGTVAVHASADPMGMASIAHAELSAKNPDDGYFFIDPIYKEGLDPKKIYPGTYNILGWNVATITTSAQNPEAIFAMLDWMTGPEGSAVQMWGPPGTDGYWTGFQADGITPQFTSKYGIDQVEIEKIQAVSGKMMWVSNTKYLDETKINYENTLSEDQKNWSTKWQQQVTWKSQGDDTPFINLIPEPDVEEGLIAINLMDIWSKARTMAIFGETDEEVLAILDQAHEDSMAAGYQQYLNFITNRWQENVKKINHK
ncbi:extracellular solute-binding protein [Paenibacillus sp. GSMTC-2017]|uniref:extracellular solute-binding protein n=1 Tax=Paenibacillus sp. GSMTC-2017 TaxID=2794350 RepID=UPI0018D67176|nr:extracellular solute-binding protein [Paenibacillus sp. GSMTC-2017]